MLPSPAHTRDLPMSLFPSFAAATRACSRSYQFGSGTSRVSCCNPDVLSDRVMQRVRAGAKLRPVTHSSDANTEIPRRAAFVQPVDQADDNGVCTCGPQATRCCMKAPDSPGIHVLPNVEDFIQHDDVKPHAYGVTTHRVPSTSPCPQLLAKHARATYNFLFMEPWQVCQETCHQSHKKAPSLLYSSSRLT
jgi:hypothetical protein